MGESQGSPRRDRGSVEERIFGVDLVNLGEGGNSCNLWIPLRIQSTIVPLSRVTAPPVFAIFAKLFLFRRY